MFLCILKLTTGQQEGWWTGFGPWAAICEPLAYILYYSKEQVIYKFVDWWAGGRHFEEVGFVN